MLLQIFLIKYSSNNVTGVHIISKQSSFIFFGDYHNCIDFSLDKMKLSVEFRRNETAQSKLSSHYLNSLEIRIATIYDLPGSRKFYQLLLDRCHIPKLIFLQHIIYYLHIFLRKLYTSIIKRQIFARVFWCAPHLNMISNVFNDVILWKYFWNQYNKL